MERVTVTFFYSTGIKEYTVLYKWPKLTYSLLPDHRFNVHCYTVTLSFMPCLSYTCQRLIPFTCGMFRRGLGFFPQTPHLLLVVHNAGCLCRRHAECRIAWRTSTCTAQKHPTTFDCYCRLVNSASNNWPFELYKKLNEWHCFYRYLVFYTPFDIGYSVSKFLPVKLVFSVMKEIYRYVHVLFLHD